MKSKIFKRITIGVLSTLLLLTIVLGIHIYVVTRPHIDAKTVAMARIDIKQNIAETDAGAIEKWVSEQQGVDHVVLNRQTNILIFTFYPIKVNASQLAENLKSTFHINAERFMPSQEQMASGCPAMSGSITGKAVTIFKYLFNQH